MIGIGDISTDSNQEFYFCILIHEFESYSLRQNAKHKLALKAVSKVFVIEFGLPIYKYLIFKYFYFYF